MKRLSSLLAVAIIAVSFSVLSDCGGGHHGNGGGGGGGGALMITTTMLANGTIGTAYSATVMATGGTSPLTFSLATGSSLPDGLSLASSGAISGTPTTAGTTSFTVQVKDSASTPNMAMATLSITINGTACSLSGQYAFMLQGQDANGMVGAAGEFSVASGTVSGGMEDVAFINSAGNAASSNFTIQSGTCTSDSSVNGRGTLVLTSNASAQPTITFQFVTTADGNAKVIEFDPGALTGAGTTGTTVSGVIKKQDSTAFNLAALAGDYAFARVACLLTGGTAAVPAAGGLIGRVTISSTGVFSNGLIDASVQAASDSQPDTGALSAVDGASGRGTGTDTFTVFGTPQTAVNTAFYVVNANEQFFITTTLAATDDFWVGEQVRQSPSPPAFAPASWSGGTIFNLTGFNPTASPVGPDVTVGRIMADGNSALAANSDENNDGTISKGMTTGSFTINTNGMGTASFSAGTATPLAGRNYSLVMIAMNTGYLLEGTVAAPSTNVQQGSFEPQTGAPFTVASLSGNYGVGTGIVAGNLVTVTSGALMLDGAGNFSGILDQTSPNPATLNSDVTVTGKFTGTYTLDTADTTGSRVLFIIKGPGGGSNPATGYIVSSSRVVLVVTTNTGDTTPTVNTLDK